MLQVTALAQGTRTLYCKMFNNASIKCLLVWRVVNRMRQLRLKLTINSPWETILGFNLMATRREKRQGMKLCSGIRTICDFSWLDQSHTWKCGKTQSVCVMRCQSRKHWILAMLTIFDGIQIPSKTTHK